MKHLSYFLLGATGLLLASCSNEDLVSSGLNPDGTANVTLTLSTPQIMTRAYSDGTTAQKLQYAVFEKKADGTLSLIDKDGYCSEADGASPETIELRKQMNFKLLTDHTYRFVFWAESADDDQGKDTNPYVITFEDGKADLAVDYTKLSDDGKVACNNENLDAFYGGVELKITGNVQMDVPLYRPFAQINVGTNDLADAAKLGYPAEDNKISSMIKTKTYKAMSLLDGTLSGNKEDVEFIYAEIPSVTDGKFPVSGYDYLAMTYILVPDEDDELVDVTFNYKQDGETLSHARTVGSVPVKRNHRTNIYGQILTSNADLTIHIEPAYDDPDLQPSELEMAAALGGSLLLQEDQNIDGSLTFLKDAVVDFGGNELNTKGGSGDAIVVRGGANVYLKNGTINENEDANSLSANIYLPKSSAAANVTLEEMKVTGAHPIYMNNPAAGTTVTIKSGEYYCNSTNGEAVYVQQGGKVIIEGGLFKNNGGTYGKFLLNLKDDLVKDGTDPRTFIEVKGGTFVNYDPSHSASENPEANFVANGYVVRENKVGTDTYYTVVPEGNKEAVVEMINGKAYCLAPALPEGATEEQLEEKGGLYVENGVVKPFAATTAGIIDALKNGTEIYFAPNTEVNLTQSHIQVQQQGITVYGNGATFGGSGEWDFSVQSYGPGATNYPQFKEGSTVNVNIYDLNNVKVWGALNQTVNLNVYLKNCTMAGNGLSDGSHSLIMVRGADEGESKVNITLEDCYAKDIQVAIHTMYVGKITVKNCEFEGVGIPVNYAKKLNNETSEVIVKDCVFNKCGMEPLNDDYNEGAANYAAPIRVVDNAGPDNSVSLLVDNCTFNNTLSTWDILLMEYRKAQVRQWFPIKYTIQNCAKEPTVREK